MESVSVFFMGGTQTNNHGEYKKGHIFIHNRFEILKSCLVFKKKMTKFSTWSAFI